MLRFKRPFVWLLLAALIVSMFPGSYNSKVSADSTLFFSPDDATLRQTVSLDPNATGNSTSTNGVIDRSKVLQTSNANLVVTGSYSQVTGSTMRVVVEQLTQNPDSKKWETDVNRQTSGVVTTDTSSPDNRFVTSGITLFNGYNKITFSGLQGNLTRSVSFYVLYTNIPYVTSLKVLGGPSALDLNEGTKVVVPSSSITLQGKAANATKVSISLDGGTPLQTSLLEDGTFFTPALTLMPGERKLQIVVRNASDSITLERIVYYFDKSQPFAKLNIIHATQTESLLNDSNPTLTTADVTTANLSGEILVPYGKNPFDATHVSFKLDKGATATEIELPVTITNAIQIPGVDGITPAYWLAQFTTTGNKVPVNVNPSLNKISLSVDYDDYSMSRDYKFTYLPNETVIQEMYYLKDYAGSGDITTKLPLNGQEVEKNNFYILVKSNVSPQTAKLMVSYLPLSNVTELSPIVGAPSTLLNTERIYHITDFPVGQQTVQFRYGTSKSFFNAAVSYISKNYIYVNNLNDGDTYTVDSKSNPNLVLKGEYFGFENIDSAQLQVNGTDSESTATGWTPLGFKVDNDHRTFNLPLPVTSTGPLVYGENKIVLTGVSKSGNNSRKVTKELRIYILDKNVSDLKQFHPTLGGDTRPTFTKTSHTNEDESNKILAYSSAFTFKDEKYVTGENKYDLVLRGGGATILNLYRGSELVFSSVTQPLMLTDIEEVITRGYPENTANAKLIYDYNGTSSDFLLRLRDIPFESTSDSHIYNLELINNTGARTTQRLEIAREQVPYRILSPVATVGDQIIVNKNFVRFDIEAEGATKVLIGKEEAIRRSDLPNRFTFDYVGLKADKSNAVKIQIVGKDSTLNETVNVYYASAVQIDTQYMAEKVATKYTVFNNALSLTFPKGTLMKGYTSAGAAKYYPDTKLLFGIADPRDGVVERKNDYGSTIDGTRVTNDITPVLTIPQELTLRFTSTAETNNFTRVSDIYWLSGGLGETASSPATNGLAPYSIEGKFTQIDLARKILPSQRGKLTLSFSPSIVDEVGTTITVFRYTDAGAWENVGGEVNNKAHTITVNFDEFGYYTVMKLRRGYLDITNHPWARNVLNGLFSKGIMSNLRADAFGADDTTTRGEFASLLVKGLSIPLSYTDQQTFFDVVPEAKTTTWSYNYIETAARAGIITGLSDGFFGPDQSLTREQAAVMIARALKLKMSANDAKLLTSLGKSFVDSGSMDFYSRPAIEAVSKAKIMEGNATTITGQAKPVYNFNPKGKLTRAEAGKIAVALLQKSTSIFPKTFN
ncbi:S-layer homology domain-containing protein [Paenibacillus sp. FSL E2-0178]|uniref:S-layer homology domain-containing protein n=1 Tax=Paenibacillus sp. FSL E2-0178 TaxID=2921361 RepID=UPI003158F89D